jgi:hypothetical protein
MDAFLFIRSPAGCANAKHDIQCNSNMQLEPAADRLSVILFWLLAARHSPRFQVGTRLAAFAMQGAAREMIS